MATISVTNIPMRVQFNVFLLKANVALLNPTFPLNGISAANSRFYFKITDFEGNTVYQNPAFDSSPAFTTPDVSGAAPTTWLTDLIDIPTNPDGSIVTGTYTITVLQRDNSQVVTDLFTRAVTKSYDYVRPTQSIDVNIAIFTPLLTLTDETNYTVTDPQDGAPLSPTNFSWNWKEYEPPVLELAPYTSNTITLQTDVFYEGPHQWYFSAGTSSSSLFYDYDTNASDCFFRVVDYIESTGVFTVDISSLCSLYCCLKAVENRYYEAFRGNQSAAVLADAMNTFQTCMAYNTLINQAVTCGSYSDVEGYITKIQAIAKCTDDCDCNEDGFPRQVTGIGNPTITQKIEEIADGSTTVFPTATADKNRLKNRSFTNNNIDIKDEGISIPQTASGLASTASFSSVTGEFTLSYAPTAGVRITIPIYK